MCTASSGRESSHRSRDPLEVAHLGEKLLIHPRRRFPSVSAPRWSSADCAGTGTQSRDTQWRENPVKGHPSERKTQSRDTQWRENPVKGKCWNPVKGHSTERKTQSRESAGTGTQSRDNQWRENPVKGKCWNPVKGHSSARKTQSRESVGTGTQSREPSEGKTQSRVSAGTQSRDTQWREITVKGKCGREEKQCFKSLKSLIYRIGEILKCFNF